MILKRDESTVADVMMANTMKSLDIFFYVIMDLNIKDKKVINRKSKRDWNLRNVTLYNRKPQNAEHYM